MNPEQQSKADLLAEEVRNKGAAYQQAIQAQIDFLKSLQSSTTQPQQP